MSALTENDLQALKDFIGQQFQGVNVKFQEANTKIDRLFEEVKEVNTKIDRLSEEVKVEIAILKGDVKSIEARFDEWRLLIAKIPDLAEKVGELKNWRQIVFVAITATIGGVVGWFARGGNLRP